MKRKRQSDGYVVGGVKKRRDYIQRIQYPETKISEKKIKL